MVELQKTRIKFNIYTSINSKEMGMNNHIRFFHFLSQGKLKGCYVIVTSKKGYPAG